MALEQKNSKSNMKSTHTIQTLLEITWDVFIMPHCSSALCTHIFDVKGHNHDNAGCWKKGTYLHASFYMPVEYSQDPWICRRRPPQNLWQRALSFPNVLTHRHPLGRWIWDLLIQYMHLSWSPASSPNCSTVGGARAGPVPRWYWEPCILHIELQKQRIGTNNDKSYNSTVLGFKLCQNIDLQIQLKYQTLKQAHRAAQ